MFPLVKALNIFVNRNEDINRKFIETYYQHLKNKKATSTQL